MFFKNKRTNKKTCPCLGLVLGLELSILPPPPPILFGFLSSQGILGFEKQSYNFKILIKIQGSCHIFQEF